MILASRFLMFSRRSVFRHVTSATLDEPPYLTQPERREALIARWMSRVCWLIVMFNTAMWSWHPLAGGDDVWAHAAIGRWIVQHHRVPTQTLFQWAHPAIPWVAHSWGSQLTFYSVLQNGGALGIVLFTIALSTLPFVLIWRDWSRRVGGQVGLIAPLLFTVAIYVAAPRFRPRPELFTALALTLLLLYLTHWPRCSRWWAWLGLPALFCVWANFHGAVALGLILLGVTVGADAVQESVQRYQGKRELNRRELPTGHLLTLPPYHWPWLLLAFVLCVAAVFVNPYGWEYRVALKPVAGLMFSKIDEWKPYWKSPILPASYLAGEVSLWGLALASWLLNPRRRWAHLLWLFIMGAAFIMARRQLWLLALTCLCVSADAAGSLALFDWRASLQNLRGLWARRRQREGPLYITLGQKSAFARRLESLPLIGSLRLSAAFWKRLAQGAVLLVIFLRCARTTPVPTAWRNKGVLERNLPDGSAHLLQRLQPRRLFNDYEYSSFLQWRFGGRPRLYIDLLNAYPDSVMTDYLAMLHPATDGHALWERNHPDAAYIRPHETTSALEDVSKWLQGNANWQKVYDGKDGAVWLRKSFATKVAALLPSQSNVLGASTSGANANATRGLVPR